MEAGRYELANFAKNVKDFVVYDQEGNRLCAPKLSQRLLGSRMQRMLRLLAYNMIIMLQY